MKQIHRGLVGILALALMAGGCHQAPEPTLAVAPAAGGSSRAEGGRPAEKNERMDSLEKEEAEPSKPQSAASDAQRRAQPAVPAVEVMPALEATRRPLSAPGVAEAKKGSARTRSLGSVSSALTSRGIGGQGIMQGPAPSPLPPPTDFDTEAYDAIEETPFASVAESPLSTFSIDVDTASYSNVRRFLNQGQLPPSGAVRIEELINYFPYAYSEPTGDAPFSITTEVSTAPWNEKHLVMQVGLQAKRVDNAALPPKNLVFLLDVSGSMDSPNKLPLLKRSLLALTDTLTERDQVAIVVYAGASGLVLPPVSGDKGAQIRAAFDRLEAGGSTNGADGIELAYAVASDMARPGSTNRVILATDGDFNVGVTSQSELFSLIEAKRRSGVFLSVLGFGMGNYKDSTLELLADKGNGNYAYIDSLAEARKVLVKEGGGTLLTLARDVKLQLEFNPDKVAAYRLIGYENRRLADRDFNDDSKDAGELGSGHSVTALYELVPPGVPLDTSSVGALRYQTARAATSGHTDELCKIALRFKRPAAEKSELIERTVGTLVQPAERTSPSFRFASAVAVFGMTLRQSKERGNASFALARRLADGALGADAEGYRREFVSLVDSAERVGR
jgi:Ca-activated chloride channel family protein